MDDENVNVARMMSPLLMLFLVLLLTIDVKRIQAGVFWSEPINRYHAAAHLVYALGALPSLLLWFDSRLSRKLRSWVLWGHIYVLAVGALLMAVTVFVDRSSLVLLGVTMLVTNLAYHVPRRPRLLFNAVALVAFGVMVACPDTPLANATVVAERLAPGPSPIPRLRGAWTASGPPEIQNLMPPGAGGGGAAGAGSAGAAGAGEATGAGGAAGAAAGRATTGEGAGAFQPGGRREAFG